MISDSHPEESDKASIYSKGSNEMHKQIQQKQKISQKKKAPRPKAAGKLTHSKKEEILKRGLKSPRSFLNLVSVPRPPCSGLFGHVAVS